ncbi:RNA 2',3'-cyclic phosphodiesterase [Paenibacillus baekrokdamisoli]|uniref:RNA 2',3'-cyclic phosphodiesterase n=1 Tax=Paenibacillus baekrokdamisoli TaxID=1712516 RepID=A0A3G9JD77_9BACL|nr:RNA 2',3'-cyclic phosphodiesterase [Paenibacillus baekrokdamisoli]MBB3068041.1 2'-5' RNA ligase [Paenibacillus baekrokdamisoli]BBH22913.1 RNA 2',3'-cyclic phosphodiesterase [Paenibacillus baekrokdamisoli]
MADKSTAIRLFVAVPLPEKWKLILAAWCDELKQQLPSFRKWTSPEDYHLTLQFLGDVPAIHVQDISQALQEAMAAGIPPFELAIENLGLFGRPENPRVLWAGIGGDSEHLHQLHTAVAAALTPLGYPAEERAYHPHLTLARQYNGNLPFEPETWSGRPLPTDSFGEILRWQVDEIVLYTSHLGSLPMYEAVERFSL